MPAHAARQPTPVYIVLLPGFLLLDLAGPAEALRIATRMGGAFELHFVSPIAAPKSSLGVAIDPVARLPEYVPDHAWLLLPGVTSLQFDLDSSATQRALSWLRRHVRPGVSLITICSGAVMAGAAGLLDGKRCTTHHTLMDKLRTLAPAARAEENRVFVIDGSTATSAGITTGIDLILELISRHCGARVALDVAREMVVWLRRDGDAPQVSPLLAYRNHLHPAVHRVQDAIAADPAREWPVNKLADIACVTPRHLARLFKAHTGIGPVEYRQQLQLTVAEQLLNRRDLSMERLAEASGFGSARDLRRVWQKHKGEALTRV
jgi:transcriptional regulator GlxA family with amidase domain